MYLIVLSVWFIVSSLGFPPTDMVALSDYLQSSFFFPKSEKRLMFASPKQLYYDDIPTNKFLGLFKK
ncbi:unnamed protein product [Anisakis simplex]|uniref:Secreted protein n=1 Tax=Anisakis simplex TaxID=6269 RepID=A0A0M3KHA2_ANISI|nr:unnamed protein product [Anisakis simplex]